jgi:riboflavin biosynthesis pyrimidine reductase
MRKEKREARNENILQLYPLPSAERALGGLYLAHDLRHYANREEPYIYANFVTSLDGRIAVKRPRGKGMVIPKNIANDRDWRLYQELAAQSDLILSTGRYLRDWAEGRAQEILQTDNPKFADLREWRIAHGLKPQPDIAIISASLDFPIPKVLTQNGRRAVFFTTAKPNAKRAREIEAQAGPVIVAGKKQVTGALLKQRIRELGYRIVYSAAGPQVLHLLLEGDVLNRLYLTYVNRILGGQEFDTIVTGELLKPAADFKMNALYFDAAGLDGLGQVFLSYDMVRG